MHKRLHQSYNQRTSLAVIGIIGCIALWIVVIAFTNMNNELNQLQKDVTELKMQVPHRVNTAPEIGMPAVPIPPAIVPSTLTEPDTFPPSTPFGY